MEIKHQSQSIELEERELKILWSKIVRKYNDSLPISLSATDLSDPGTFWTTHSQKFGIHFRKITDYKNSRIPLGTSERDIAKSIDNTYLYNHFIKRFHFSIRQLYLQRILFYIAGRIVSDWKSYLENIGIVEAKKLPEGIAPSLHYLEGNWVSFNRNLESGSYACCYYEFTIAGNEMRVKREAYSSEKRYVGKVLVQQDSYFLFDLDGELQGKKKFVMAYPQKVKPATLRCVSSAFDIRTSEPIFVKEFLIKIPKKHPVKLTQGKVLNSSESKAELANYFGKDDLDQLLIDFEDFIGIDEVPFFALADLSLVKNKHLDKIKQEQKVIPRFIQNMYIHVHFNRLGKSLKAYERNIVKYHKGLSKSEIHTFRWNVNVQDEYIYTKYIQYNKTEIQKYNEEFSTETNDGHVDAHALFPLTADQIDNGLKEPDERENRIVVDAESDTFISTANFVNDFNQSQRISIHFQERTVNTEIVIDFGSIEEFDSLGIFIDEISYHYNEADQFGAEIAKTEIIASTLRHIKLIEVNRQDREIVYLENQMLQKENRKLFTIKVDFQVEKGDYLYIHFHTKL